MEAEIDGLKSRHARSSGLRQLYESQLKDLKRVAEQMRVQRVREVTSHDHKILALLFCCISTSLLIIGIWSVQDTSLAAKEAMLGQLDMLKAKYDEAVAARKKTEHDIETLRPVRNSFFLTTLTTYVRIQSSKLRGGS